MLSLVHLVVSSIALGTLEVRVKSGTSFLHTLVVGVLEVWAGASETSQSSTTVFTGITVVEH